MGVTLIAITPVMLHGQIIKPDEKFTCDEHYAKKLVAGGSVKIFGLNGEENNENGSFDDGNGQKSDENGSDSNGSGESSNAMTEEEMTKKFDKLLRDDLILRAEKHKIELKKDATKPEIIKKLIEAGVKSDEKDI
ncbi:hypothetical protein ACOMCU_24805 [Lysinibacillus sp. UGB7]|uniref:hypothetical protein n=1 Tax=Lysinibacillus sp. UGB7 TaxID=3411039 RepID=UPI003B7DE881